MRPLKSLLLSFCFLLALTGFGRTVWLKEQAHHKNYQRTQAHTPQENYHHKTWEALWEGTADDPVAFFTAVLTVFTGLLALVSFIQIGYLIRADRNAADSAEAARDAFKIAQTQAGHLANSAVEAKRLAEATHLALTEAQKQFVVAHRPRLSVRHIILGDDLGEMVGQPTMFWENGKTIEGSLILVNQGGSEARITNSFYRIVFSRESKPPFGLTREEENETAPATELFPIGEILAAGQSCFVPLTATVRMKPDRPGAMRRFQHEQWIVFVHGLVQYRDRQGSERIMGFCRSSRGLRSFRSVDDPDYEYQD